jgi:peptidoglycan/LPS O-acetylase OafA/YrhL
MLSRFDFRHNAIGFLRLFFAAVVVLSHAYPIGGFGLDPAEVWSEGRENLGNLAVAGFFVLSGFLITRSAERAPNVGRFIWHRFLRIFPAFWVCLVVTVLVFAPVAAWLERGTLGPHVPFDANSSLRYVMFNADLTMRQYGIGGLLANVPYPRAFDGSLWTLRFEFACYLAVAFLALVGVIRRRRAVVAAAAAALFVAYAIPLAFAHHLPEPWAFDALLHGNNRLAAELVVYFFAGAVAYLYRDVLPLTRWAGVLALIAGVVALHWSIYSIVDPIAFSLATLWLAAELPLRDVDRRIDLSYGLYIYAFPLQQLAAAAGLMSLGVLGFTVLPLVGALALACVSWFVVERPSLALKHVPFTSLVPRFVTAWARR